MTVLLDDETEWFKKYHAGSVQTRNTMLMDALEQTLTPEDLEIIDLGETAVNLKEELLRNRMYEEAVRGNFITLRNLWLIIICFRGEMTKWKKHFHTLPLILLEA